MKNKPNIIAVIPARGGSKGIPKKNIKLLNGKPLIEYSIESAIDFGGFDKIIVSTDSVEISEICKKYDEISIIMRPSEISTDDSKTEEALIHVCDQLIINEQFYTDYVLTLEPTSPFRSVDTINKCIKKLIEKDIDSVIGVVEIKSVFGKIIDDKFVHLIPNQPRRRQDRNGIYEESSTIYGTSVEVLRSKKSVIGNSAFPLIIPKNEAIDINEAIDFEIAKLILKNK